MALFALPPNYAEGRGSVFHVTDTPRLPSWAMLLE